VEIPSIKQTIRDPGLGVTPAAITSFMYTGCSSSGTVGTVYAFSNPADVIDTLGQGPLPEDLCYHLAIAGGPVYAIRLTGSIAGAAGSVTKTAFSTSTGTVAVSGAAFDAYVATVEIRVTGALGVAEFRYTLDSGKTYSPQLIVPSGGSYAVPNTNLTLTFTAGGGPIILEKGDLFTFVCTAPGFGTTDLAVGITSLKASNINIAAIVLSGKFATGSASATVAAAMAVHASALFAMYRPIRFMLDAGAEDAATTKTAFASFSSDRASKVYGSGTCTSAKPIVGWGSPQAPNSRVAAGRCAASLISTDPSWFAAGALQGVTAVTHDEFRTELMDQAGFTTLRTYQGASGFFVTNCRLSSAPGSDYEFWQHGRVMDVATATAYAALLPFLSSSVRTLANGSIDPRDAANWNSHVKDALRSVLLDPDNAQGTQGHVSALDAAVDQTTNVLVSKTVKVKIAIRPLGYAKTIVNELSFSANVGG
jgi:hypothetical protein